MPEPNAADKEKHTKLIRAICIGVLLILAILGWHFYEYFIHDKSGKTDETALEHELIEFSQKLYADELQHNAYIANVNFQGKAKGNARDDRARLPLLNVNNELLQSDSSSTFALMKRLFDNYELDTLTAETVTPEEEQEELDFLNAVLKTAIMKRAMAFLQMKGAVSGKHDEQLKLLKDIWFTQYSRGQGRVGSSGFEHVFLAELKDQSVLGLHNWLYFNEQEQQGKLDYKGFIKRIDLGKEHQHLLALRFTFHDILKSYNTVFVGTSPELELSLYTVCFVLSSKQACPVKLGNSNFNIITHAWDWHGKKTLASAYPSIEN